MNDKDVSQEELTEKIKEMKERISQLEEENLSQSSNISELLRFKTISDSAEQGIAIVDIIGRLILIPFPILESLPKLNLADLPAEQFTGAWWLIPVAIVRRIISVLVHIPIITLFSKFKPF